MSDFVVGTNTRAIRSPLDIGTHRKICATVHIRTALFGVFDQILARNHKTIVAHVYREQCSAGSLGTMKIEIHAPSKPAVVVSLLLAILALIGYFVDSSFAFSIAMFAYIVGALGVLVEI